MKTIEILGRLRGETIYQALARQNGHYRREGDPAKYVLVKEMDRCRYHNVDTGDAVVECSQMGPEHDQFMYHMAEGSSGRVLLYKYAGFMTYIIKRFHILYGEKTKEYAELEKKLREKGEYTELDPWSENLSIPREWVEDLSHHAEMLHKIKETSNMDEFKSYMARHLTDDIDKEYSVEYTWNDIESIVEEFKELLSMDCEEFFFGDVG